LASSSTSVTVQAFCLIVSTFYKLHVNHESTYKYDMYTNFMMWRIDPFLSGDYLTPAIYTPATIEQRGYATRF
jgi:hypothetical protein